jgi:hypothetical protein
MGAPSERPGPPGPPGGVGIGYWLPVRLGPGSPASELDDRLTGFQYRNAQRRRGAHSGVVCGY